MSDLHNRGLAVALLSLGCASESDTLSRLVDRWVEETVEISEPAVTDALVVAGLAVELCVSGEELDWSSVEIGHELPLSDRLVEALGFPLVDEVEDYGSGAVEVTLGGVVVVDREEAILRFVTSRDDQGLSFEASVLDGQLVEEDQPEGEPFGRLAYEVEGDCVDSHSRVGGTARWTDLQERTHTVRLPADSDLSFGVVFSTDLPWLPENGIVAWSGRIGGQERTVTTFDAADLTVEDDIDVEVLPRASWPSVVSGPDWVSQVSIAIAPGG